MQRVRVHDYHVKQAGRQVGRQTGGQTDSWADRQAAGSRQADEGETDNGDDMGF